MKHKSDWGIIGMGVMGTSLARNMARNGLTVSLFNRHLEGLEEKVAAAKVTRYPELAQAQPFPPPHRWFEPASACGEFQYSWRHPLGEFWHNMINEALKRAFLLGHPQSH